MDKRERALYFYIPALASFGLLGIAFIFGFPSSLSTFLKYAGIWLEAFVVLLFFFAAIALIVKGVVEKVIDENFE